MKYSSKPAELPPLLSAGTPDRVRVHYQSPRVALLIPGLQAFVTGVVVALPVGLVAALVDFPSPWQIGLVTWALTQALVWAGLLLRWMDIVSALENFLQKDLNGDGFIGDEEPQRETPTVRVEYVENQGRHVEYVDLPVDEEKLIDLASGVLAGLPFAESQWSGAGALLSRSQFRALRDEFMRRGWLEWINPDARAQGVQFTRQGGAVIRHFASMAGDASPTLAERDA